MQRHREVARLVAVAFRIDAGYGETMTWISRTHWPAVVAFVAIAGALAAPRSALAQGDLDPSVTYRIPIGDAPIRGPAEAPITIVELSDFGCPHCVRAQNTLLGLMQLYPGQIRLVYRHNPLDPVDGTLAARASNAAGEQGMFWAMHDRIFAAGGIATRSQLEGFAVEMGLDMARFRRDLDSPAISSQVRADSIVARRLGVLSTPVFFVNGRPVKGARPLGVFVRVVEEELVKARELLKARVRPSRLYDAIMAGAVKPGEEPDLAGDRDPGEWDDDHGFAGLELDRLHDVGDGLPGHSVGPADALVTVVAFTDFECPFCAKLAPVLAQVRADYPDDVRIVIRHLPLRIHPGAQLAAEAVAAAAAQGKMWPLQETILTRSGPVGRSDLELHARSVGLDLETFRAALDDRKYFNAVAVDAAAGRAIGITGTPTIFVNGAPIRGVVPYPVMRKKVLEPMLAEARALMAKGVSRTDVQAVLLRGSDGLFPDSSGTLQADEPDAHNALLQACRSRDDTRANHMYDQLKPGIRRDRARAACRTHGVDLVDTRRP